MNFEKNQIWSLPSNYEVSKPAILQNNRIYRGGRRNELWGHGRRVQAHWWALEMALGMASQRTRLRMEAEEEWIGTCMCKGQGEREGCLGNPGGSIGLSMQRGTVAGGTFYEWRFVMDTLSGQVLTSTLFSLLSRINSFCSLNCCCSSWSEKIRSVAAESWLRKIFIFLNIKMNLTVQIKSNIWHFHN